MLKEIQLFDKLGLVPHISSIYVEKQKVTKITANLQINVPFERGKTSWILDSKVLKILNVVVTISTNKALTEVLSTNKKAWTYTGIEGTSFEEGKDYFQSVKKLQPSYLSFNIESNNIDSSKTLFTGFIEDAVFNSSDLDHLAIFVAVDIDRKEVAKRFKVNPAKYKDILGYCTSEILIENSLFMSKKVTDLSVFQNTTRFNFSNLRLSEISTISHPKVTKLLDETRTNRLFSSELFYSIDRTSKVTGFFIVDILALFRNESSLASLFDKKEFLKVFFSKEDYYLPKKVKVIRQDEYLNETTLYEGIYTSLIDADNLLMNKIQLTDDRKLYISFKDKTSGELTRKYRYRVVFEFEDISVKYLERILEKVNNFVLDTKKIINIANSGKNFDSVANAFNDRFYRMLERDDLSIKNTILSIYSVLSQFINLTSEEISNIINLSNSKYSNFETLEQIHNILAFLQTQISILKINISNTITLVIISDNFFDTIVDKTVCLNFKEEIIQTTNNFGYPYIRKDDLLKRVSLEIKKYYGVTDIVHDSKFSYFTPLFFGNSDIAITQEIIDYSNIGRYNRALIDIYYNMYQKISSSKVHVLDKLLMNLLYNDIDLNEFNIKVENIETIKFPEISNPINVPGSPVLRTGAFRVGDTVGSLLYIW